MFNHESLKLKGIIDFGGYVMQANWEKQEGNQGLLTFGVSANEIGRAHV